MTLMKLIASAFLFAFAVSDCQASSSYHTASPPNTIVLGYPASSVPVGQLLNIGADGAGLEVAGDYYGFTFNTSISVLLPNGTNVPAVSVSNVVGLPQGPGQCQGSHSTMGPSTDSSVPLAFGARFNATPDAGVYTVFWNVTYGTSTDPAIANQTLCDLSRLSYQSWLFNATFTAVAESSTGQPEPSTTKVLQTFSPSPTGSIMSNGASASTYSALLFFVVTLCIMLQTV